MNAGHNSQHTMMAANEMKEGCMLGSLDAWPLSDVLLWLHQSKRTAMLRVGAGFNAGVLMVHNGQLFRAEWGELRGEHALLELLSLRQGTFTLMQREMPQALPNITRPTAEVLFQCTVALDEGRRNEVA